MNSIKYFAFAFLGLFIFSELFGQNTVGYFNYGRSSRMSWANHIAVNQSGKIIMAGHYDSKPNFVVADSGGTYITSRSVASAGELFGPAVDNSGNIFVGGYYGTFGTQKKYIVKYTSAMAQSFARDYGPGTIRYIILDGTDIVATGFSCKQLSPGVYENKACVLKIDNAGTIIWYKEFTIDSKQSDAFVIEKTGSAYYVAGTIYESGAARSYVMELNPSNGNVNWLKTYYLAGNAPHITGMSLSSTGIILCGATAKLNGGNMLSFKIDYSGNVVWTRLINNCYSWYQQNQATYNIWGINCAVDIYGSVIIAYEDDPSYGILAKLNESTGAVTWIKRVGNSGDGYHSIAAFDCMYLAAGWFGPTIGTSWDYGLTIMDTSGYAGACPTTVTRTNSTPAITVSTTGFSTVNLATNSVYGSAQNTTEAMSHNNVCKTTSTTCSIPLPVSLLSFTAKAECEKLVNTLRWTTISETNNDYFTIEKSYDGYSWTQETTVKGAGNSSAQLNYEYNTPVKKGDRTLYYRLLQTDFDGTINNTNAIVSATNDCISHLGEFVVYPNPSKDILNLLYNSEFSGKVYVAITDMYGKIILNSYETIREGDNTINYITSEFPSGIYMISLTSDTHSISKKFIKE
ncbi:MAG: T9SS type A sorting domain-containing protein [Flavobacteriales bacterium]|nr:T9SS type A sorting domain-containing protein [Flavobacteriales bacterium]